MALSEMSCNINVFNNGLTLLSSCLGNVREVRFRQRLHRYPGRAHALRSRTHLWSRCWLRLVYLLTPFHPVPLRPWNDHFNPRPFCLKLLPCPPRLQVFPFNLLVTSHAFPALAFLSILMSPLNIPLVSPTFVPYAPLSRLQVLTLNPSNLSWVSYSCPFKVFISPLNIPLVSPTLVP